MVKVLSAIDKALQWLYDYIMMICGAAVALLILYGALLRYVLKIDFYGSEEIILMFGYWLYFVGSMSAARDKSHLSADMITVFTNKPKTIHLLAIVRDVLSLVICALAITWCGQYWAWTWKLKPVTTVHRIPFFIQQFPMCMSFVLWGVYLVRDTIRAILVYKKDTDKGGVQA